DGRVASCPSGCGRRQGMNDSTRRSRRVRRMHRPYEADFGPMADPRRLGVYIGAVCAVGLTTLVVLVGVADVSWPSGGGAWGALWFTVFLIFFGEFRVLLN